MSAYEPRDDDKFIPSSPDVESNKEEKHKRVDQIFLLFLLNNGVLSRYHNLDEVENLKGLGDTFKY